jgi:hypothetical protein
MSDDIRLQRIEEKLDKLADVVVGMARVDEIDSHVISMRERMNVVSKVMWVMSAGVITAIITHFQEML